MHNWDAKRADQFCSFVMLNHLATEQKTKMDKNYLDFQELHLAYEFVVDADHRQQIHFPNPPLPFSVDSSMV